MLQQTKRIQLTEYHPDDAIHVDTTPLCWDALTVAINIGTLGETEAVDSVVGMVFGTTYASRMLLAGIAR